MQRLLSAAIFIGFVVLVEHYFGWVRLLAPWQTLSVGQILGAVGLALVSYWTRAMRLYDYFRPPRMATVPAHPAPTALVHPCTAEMPKMHDSMDGGGRALPGANAEERFSGHHNIQHAFSLCFKVTLQHNLLNNLLPMRAGEISFPVLMMRHFAIPMVRSVPALFWFRLLDLHTLGACAFFAAIGLRAAPASLEGEILWLILLLIWMLLPLLLFWGQARWQITLQKKNSTGRFHELLQKILGSLPQTPSDFWRAWAWTVITWIVKLGIFAWVLMLFVNIAPTAALMGAIAGDLTSVLPVHGVAGMGTYEAGVVAGLLPYDVTPQNAFPAAVNLHLFLLASTLIGGGISLFIGNKNARE